MTLNDQNVNEGIYMYWRRRKKAEIYIFFWRFTPGTHKWPTSHATGVSVAVACWGIANTQATPPVTWHQHCCGLLRYCNHTSHTTGVMASALLWPAEVLQTHKPHHRCHGISIAVACCSAVHPQAKQQRLGKSCQWCQWILTHFVLTLPALSHHNSSHSNHYFTSA